MAIKKQKTNNQGIVYEYFVAQAIPNIMTKKTQIILCGFLDQEARENGANFIERISFGEVDGLYLTGEQAYAEVKKSNIIKELIEVTEEEKVEGYEEQFKDVETNFFVDAEDC